ncbi:MAG: integration host factor subunit beta [Rickettsiales bacterium]|jgi:integration host factor subunit beta|nr:integration host factor subunit beta [Rickettsiales bacterium]
MKRADLITSVQVQFSNMSAESAAAITDRVLDRLIKAVADGDRVELRGFGVFAPRARMTKIGYRPRTGERVAVAAGRTVKFRPSSQLVREMNPALLQGGKA